MLIREELQRKMMEECTFKPKINEESRLFVRERIGNNSVEELSERMYRAQEFKERKKHFIEQMRKMKEEELRKECTFKPEIVSKNSRSRPSSPAPKARYLDSMT
jgi:hypothetical protein